MSNKQFLRDCPLTIKIPTARVVAFEHALRLADESFPYRIKSTMWDDDGKIYHIVCETTYFADAYFHLGKMTAQAFEGLLKNPFQPEIKTPE